MQTGAGQPLSLAGKGLASASVVPGLETVGLVVPPALQAPPPVAVCIRVHIIQL